MPCPEPPMGISGVGSFPVQSGGSLFIFQLFRCRDLALNSFFLLFLVADMFLYCGCLDAPTFVHSHTFISPHTFIHLQGSDTPPYVPHTPLCICMFSEASACCGGCRGPLTCWTPPLHAGHLPSMRGASPCLTPPLIGWLPCASVCFRDICMWYGEYYPYVGGLGVFPICWGFRGISIIGCPYGSSCTFL